VVGIPAAGCAIHATDRYARRVFAHVAISIVAVVVLAFQLVAAVAHAVGPGCFEVALL
jgi:hypothetical protein